MSNADTDLLDAWEEKRDESNPGWVRITVGGSGHCKAIMNAVVAHYNELSGRERPTLEQLEASVGEKVTLVYSGENMLGAGLLKAREGRLFGGSNGGVSILPKGARRNGYRVNPDQVLDMLPGYATAKAREIVEDVRKHYPVLTEITTERLSQLPAYDGDRDQPITLCAFGTWRMPDGAATDSIQLIATYEKEDDICDGGVLLIRPEFGFSEHGSCYGTQITRDFGEVVGFKPISFKEAIELCDLPFDEAYARVIPNAPVLA